MPTLQELISQIAEFDKTQDYQSVIDLLTDDILQVHQDPQLYIAKAMALQLQGNPDLASQAWPYAQAVIKLTTADVSGYIARGEAFYILEEFKKAISEFDVVLDANAGNNWILYLRAVCWYRLQQYEYALADYSKLIAQTPVNNQHYFYERGLTKNNLKRYRSAIEDFDKALEINTNFYQASCDKGLAFFMLEKYDEALENFNHALNCNPKYSLALYNRGLLHQVRKKKKEAEKDYGNAIKSEQGNPTYVSSLAYNNRGNLYLAEARFELALADFNAALNLDSNLGEAYLNRGMIFQQQLNYADAKADFLKAILFFKKDAELYGTFLNFLEEQMKLIEEKITEDDKLLKIDAKEKDKSQFRMIDKKLDKYIDSISKSVKPDRKAVVHYTKLFVADIYVNSLNAKMNYSNAIYMNDPNEGKILMKYLNDSDIKKAFENGERLSELSVYIGSFLPAANDEREPGHNDELIMWRTYGRDSEGREACGCSIVIDSDFFKPPVLLKQVTGETADMLSNIVYVRDRMPEPELVIDGKSDLMETIDKFKNQLLNLLALKKGYDPGHDFSIMIDKLLYKKYSKIAYLFKSADYEYEHEIRVVKYVPRNSDTIKCYPMVDVGKPRRLYVESANPVLPFMQKIYLGPKVVDHLQWSLYLDYQIKQRQNELKLNNKSGYKFKSNSIEISKSTNEFV